MRGRPLIEWLVFAGVWALLLIPLLRITGGRESTLQENRTTRVLPAVVQPGVEPVWLRLTFSESPDAFTLYAGGESVWHGTADGVLREQLAEIVCGAAGPDLVLEAQWVSPVRRAVELVVEPVEGRVWRGTLWTEQARIRERMVLQ